MQDVLKVTIEQREELETITEKLKESLQLMEQKFEVTEKKTEMMQAKLEETTRERYTPHPLSPPHSQHSQPPKPQQLTTK